EGNDTIFLWDGDDLARGGRDDDSIFGENGNDKLWGQQGHDYLDGGAGDDILKGGGGHDQLFGSDGNDTLKGGGGRDILAGGDGNDTLTGNNGRDTFIFSLGDDVDTITDFDVTRDTIELDADLLGLTASTATAADVLSVANQVGNDVVIDFGNGDSLILEDVQLTTLAADDFSFF
ncbi:MAG: calcium-binding protein, partial [Pseudomonadota bacterium]